MEFLDKYPIKEESKIGNQAIYLTLSNPEGLFDLPFTINVDSEKVVNISGSLNILEIESNYIKKLQFFRDVYNDIYEQIFKTDLEKRIHSERILQPKFQIMMEHYGFTNQPYKKNTELFHNAFRDLVSILSAEYPGMGTELRPDFLHGKRAVLSPLGNYTIEIPNPNTNIETSFFDIDVTANERSDFIELEPLSKKLINAIISTFKKDLKHFGYERTKGVFYFFFDTKDICLLDNPIKRYLIGSKAEEAKCSI